MHLRVQNNGCSESDREFRLDGRNCKGAKDPYQDLLLKSSNYRLEPERWQSFGSSDFILA
jgi:hypothetical protein